MSWIYRRGQWKQAAKTTQNAPGERWWCRKCQALYGWTRGTWTERYYLGSLNTEVKSIWDVLEFRLKAGQRTSSRRNIKSRRGKWVDYQPQTWQVLGMKIDTYFSISNSFLADLYMRDDLDHPREMTYKYPRFHTSYHTEKMRFALRNVLHKLQPHYRSLTCGVPKATRCASLQGLCSYSLCPQRKKKDVGKGKSRKWDLVGERLLSRLGRGLYAFDTSGLHIVFRALIACRSALKDVFWYGRRREHKLNLSSSHHVPISRKRGTYFKD